MGSYELDDLNHLHYTGDGWIQTKEPLTDKQIKLFNDGKLNLLNLNWIDNTAR